MPQIKVPFIGVSEDKVEAPIGTIGPLVYRLKKPANGQENMILSGISL